MTTITHATNDLDEHVGDIEITEESRFFTLENLRILGNVTIGKGCSHYVLRNLRIEGGGLRILGLNWHGMFERIWIDNAPEHGIYAGGFDKDDHCNALIFSAVFARACKGWGWLMAQQLGLVMMAAGADQNQSGGFLFNHCTGTYQLTAESNQGTAVSFYESHGVCMAPFIDVLPGKPAISITGDSTVQVLGTRPR